MVRVECGLKLLIIIHTARQLYIRNAVFAQFFDKS